MPGFFCHWTVPRLMLTAAFGLAFVSMLLAALASYGGVGAVRLSQPTESTVVDLRVEDMPDGSLRVIALADTRSELVLAPGREGLLRVALRSFARERALAGMGPEVPFRLGRQRDGRLWIRDLATGRLLYLDAYGVTSIASFARLFESMGNVR